MKGAFCSFLIVLQSVNWVYSTSRTFPPTAAPYRSGQKTSISLVPLKSNKGFDRMYGNTQISKEVHYKRIVSKIGSSRPSCEHKCFGCMPCEAVQIPTTTSRKSHMSIQYANYEPEGWKCKCGPSFYTP